MTKQEQIEEMAKIIDEMYNVYTTTAEDIAEGLYNAGYRKIQDGTVVLSREEYEMLKSLYDTQKGAIMTSSIGDLPLTVEGLRKAVDEITRLNRVETELQELNAKYYNEAKDLRRELKQTRKETAKEGLGMGHVFDELNKIYGDDWQTMDDCPYKVVGNIYDNKEEEE